METIQINNLNISKYLKWTLAIAALVGVVDLLLSFNQGRLGEIFTGYSGLFILGLLIAAYVFVGFPIFRFNSNLDYLKIKSHLALSKSLGKELVISRENLVSFEIDSSGFRKKLIVCYIVGGREVKEKFSISLLNNSKIRNLAKSMDMIADPSSGYHLFI